ncbi:MAG: 2,3,4,5-tetrahydropyridine-2,6-dicarboxylate N-succinyltransferase [Candidatus Calescibacterium sp.]|nr:2,3,4,5-tetrahydropyridine-2,6-dicarboxylate N-succinyltransferase [Candidatus Calescibacterium sp.]MCX7971775.1 2,3,4,5-tetrahydropyridine-2,6-dicarboxylate N-succinyltransferase [bacterium]MDW8195381.1 2,3,4,5-tetrahydropyridine-2,6-dicarboxylate N-succinyltransferase [Candidatus Calescibacterium sp.]
MEEKIELAWEMFNRQNDIKEIEHKFGGVVRRAVKLLDSGNLRVAENRDGKWFVNEFVKKAILLYFAITKSKKIRFGGFDYYDKLPLKKIDRTYRVVPGAIIRYGSFIESNCIIMPSFINVGAYIGSGTMVDTWVTVGSCAQIGRNVHLAGGVGIGGVLEPPSAMPVIIEDNCFIGSRCVIVEGIIVRRGAVLAANVSITSSTKIIDINTGEIYQGEIPENSIVVPGTYLKEINGRQYGISAALIIGKRKHSTDIKTALNEILRK